MTQRVENIDEELLGGLAAQLRSGHLVSFPTETVYGLGADAANVQAVSRIFEVKGRPAQDPLIVHGPSIRKLVNWVSDEATGWQRDVFEVLGRVFWPGPLTLVLPAQQKLIVPAVTANTGWVGLRCPAHPLAIRFLERCACPVAAPSANLFGHVSPTTAQHVWDDFPAVDNLWILDGGRCGFGIESTVARVNEDKTIDILRRGGIAREQLAQSLVDAGLLPSKVAEQAVRIVERYFSHDTSKSVPVMQAPGQLLVHYAPRLPTQMVGFDLGKDPASDVIGAEISAEQLKHTIVIDFAGHLNSICDHVAHYRDLSANGNVTEAVHGLFDCLRWAEALVEGDSCQWRLWIFNPRSMNSFSGDEIYLALQDRITRAASGKIGELSFKPDSGRVFFLAR
ncbi:threonylcarbamoyl-AMP synthase [bacterium]|nr:threonylcarbamoyl-AMP synthase [bacterium]